MQLRITHTTQYDYDEPVHYALQKVRLRPTDWPVQEIAEWDLAIEGGRIEASYRDHYGNHTDLVSTDPGATTLRITASGTAITKDGSGVLGRVYGRAPLWHFRQPTPVTLPGKRIAKLAEQVARHETTLEGLHALSAAILTAAPYELGPTNADTTAEEALGIGRGVCQDHTHIFIAAARAAGFPARYVSGYLMLNEQVDQDASHAWAEAHVDGLGWVGFDVSNGVSPDEKYVRIAMGRDARGAAPVSGMRLGSSDEAMIVSLQVQQ
ncbi:transglutaminase family protein [Roseovarius sp. SCSIO 43702]|uniref:transglutaminase family protein n=1 Tax=Roseovarius sp. SCSIO 43702 TaxID=2823043 RepID=UPI001C73C2EE|nr:transglutaminase family protein [Roseovarius sp. SCSIO 43702]QYX56253.1 transglutaminase family protein [Roseovarius sp. SCSIO 43702]